MAKLRVFTDLLLSTDNWKFALLFPFGLAGHILYVEAPVVRGSNISEEMMKRMWICLGTALLMGFGAANAARQMEWLNRGLVAVKTSGGVFLSWRVLGTEGSETSFNLYRDGEKIASISGTEASNYTDAKGTASNRYSVKAVVNGKEQAADAAVSVWSDQYLTVNLDRPTASGITYSPNDIAVGDVDGDGEFELILKWDPSNSKDNSQKGKTGNVIIDCYKMNGKKLWRIDLGVNIRAGAHYTQMLVGDYDSDGKAELAVKTAPGTKDASGKYLSKGPAANGAHTSDFRNSNGYILTGDEYLTIFNGETGVEMATVNYNPGRGTVKSWGDSYGNRVDRFLATNAYLDGKKPSMVFQRGYYTRMAITAYDWDGKSLTQRWYYNAATSGKECYGQGNHNISAGDVDGDGFDEIIEGSCAIDHDGKFMYRTGKGHGDAIHFGDLDPDNDGLEVWQVHEEKPYGYDLHDARTGKLLFSETSSGDNGRGVAGDVDSTNRGHELWSAANWNTYTVKGQILSSSRPAYNFRIYWDGDLLDELLDNTTISKWNSSKGKNETFFQMQGNSCNTTKATPNFSGDILGDWREEVILHDGASKLYIYTTTIPTVHRMYTLAHDPVYRNGMSWQNTAYNQPPHLGFWLYGNKGKFPKPDITLIGDNTPKAAAIVKQGAGSSSQVIVKGDSIVPFTFAIEHADGGSVDGLPAGVTAAWNASTSSFYFSGTPLVEGEFTYTITTKGGNADFGEATRSGTITILCVVESGPAPLAVKSDIEAAVPTDAKGMANNNHENFRGEGFYDFENSLDSYGIYHLVSPKEYKNATMVLRYAHGKTDTRRIMVKMNEGLVGSLTFKPTADWDTWDSVSVGVSLQKGLNVLYLKSLEEAGAPNIDQIGFDVEGVVLFEDSTQLSAIDTLSAEVAGDSSGTTGLTRGDYTAEDDFAGNMRIAAGIHLNLADGTLIARESGYAQVDFFDMTGHQVACLARNVPAGASDLSREIRALPEGVYMVRVKFNGRTMQNAVQVRVER